MKKETKEKESMKYGKNVKKKRSKVKGKSRELTPTKECEERDNAESKKHWNDASWYIPDENLRRIVGSISYQTTLGVPTEFQCTQYGNGGVVLDTVISSYEPVNVMAIELFPYPGSDISVTGSPIAGGPLTVASRKLFAAIAALTGRGQNYTTEDLALAILAVGDLVSGIAFAQRLLGIMFTYNPRNRGIPRKLVEAMGIDFDSLNENITRFRDSLNLIITSANNIRMVKDIKYFTKCWELYSHIYKDAESGMAQYYVTKPAGFLELDETPDPSTHEIETTLKWHFFGQGNTLVPYNILLRRLESMVNALLTSTTLKDVYNDILNYVTKQGGNLMGFSYVPELYSILPEYNETFMNQIHNMDWGGLDLSNYTISGDPLTNSVQASDIFYKSSATRVYQCGMSGDDLLDMLFTDNPSYDDTIDAVMFKRVGRDVLTVDGKTSIRSAALPDHPVLYVKVYSATGDFYQIGQNVLFDEASRAQFLALSVFRACPIYYDITDGTNYFRRPVAPSLNYYTTIGYQKAKGIYDYAFMGLFDAEVKGVSPF